MNFQTSDINQDLMSKRHTWVKLWNIDFPSGEDEYEPIGETYIIPALIDSVTSCEEIKDYVLVNIENGASYWILHSDFLTLYKAENV